MTEEWVERRIFELKILIADLGELRHLETPLREYYIGWTTELERLSHAKELRRMGLN